jgi:hypothetical protein
MVNRSYNCFISSKHLQNILVFVPNIFHIVIGRDVYIIAEELFALIENKLHLSGPTGGL